MTAERTSIFDQSLDVTDFAPKPAAADRPQAQAIDATAGKRFKSGEAQQPVDQPFTKRRPMVFRTGRDTVLSVKLRRETIDAFYQIAEEEGWKAGETFEQALEALIAKRTSR
jgi:hypothetical protein